MSSIKITNSNRSAQFERRVTSVTSITSVTSVASKKSVSSHATISSSQTSPLFGAPKSPVHTQYKQNKQDELQALGNAVIGYATIAKTQLQLAVKFAKNKNKKEFVEALNNTAAKLSQAEAELAKLYETQGALIGQLSKKMERKKAQSSLKFKKMLHELACAERMVARASKNFMDVFAKFQSASLALTSGDNRLTSSGV